MFKMKMMDVIVDVLLILSLIVIYFLWGCRLDAYVVIMAGLVFFVGCVVGYVQRKRKSVSEVAYDN